MANPNIWAPGAAIDANSSVKFQAFTATASQTLFTIPNNAFSYVVGTSSLLVFVSGVAQRPGIDFFETSSTSFTLSTPVAEGTIVLAMAMVEVSANLQNTTVITYDYVATGGETVLTLSFTYQQGGNQLHVFRNGLHQEYDYDYTETTSNSITLTTAADADDRFIVVGSLFVSDDEASQLRSDLASSTGTTYVNHLQSGAGAVTRTVQSKLRESVSVKDFGAVGDGVTDDTAAIQAAITYAASSSKTVFFPDGIYSANSLTLTSSMSMSAGAMLRYNGANNGTLMTASGNGLNIETFFADANFNNCSLLVVSGNDSQLGTIKVKNVIASATGADSLYGVAFSGNDNTAASILVENFENTGWSNESFPQGVAFTDTATRNVVGSVVGDVTSSLVVIGSSSGITEIGSIIAKNIADNGLYQLGGYLQLGKLSYINDADTVGNEPAVFAGGDAVVGAIQIIGGSNAIGFDDCGDVSIQTIQIQESAVGRTAGSIMRTRSGNTVAGSIYIGSVSGILKQSTTLFLLSTGTIASFTMDSLDVEYFYTVASSTTSWAVFDACQQFSVKEFDVRIIDTTDALTSATNFWLRAASANLLRPSYVGNIRVTIYQSDKTTVSDAGFRGQDFVQDLIQVDSGVFAVNIGPYLLKVGTTTPTNGGIYASAIPLTGTWKRGTVLWNTAPSAGGTPGWVCVTAGTPGTWKAMANLAA